MIFFSLKRWRLSLTQLIVGCIFCSISFSCQKEKTIGGDPSVIIPTPPPPIDYLALGDSYTIGQGVVETDRYPNLLARQLEMDNFEMASTTIIARTGWKTGNLIQAIEDAELQDTFELVSLLIGVNNQFQGVDFSFYETQFPQLLQTAIDLVGGDPQKVVVLSIPDYGFTPFGQNVGNTAMITEGINKYNAFNKMWTISEGVAYFDITPISRRGIEEPELVASDGLHPSGEMYGLWVDQIYDTVKDLLLR